MIELLAPAGDFDSLKAAVLNGADAVYLGGKEFSARQFAGNFDREEMVEAVRFCHCYNTKLYATMNTLYDNDELTAAMDYAAFLYEIGVDALIIQDIGFLKLLREQLPDFEIHGSTQMSIHNHQGVNMLYEMGVKRVVLARELSIRK
jgi:U32 family peptidase